MMLIRVLVLFGILGAVALAASEEAVEVHRTSGKIVINGDLSDPGWKDAARVDRFYETLPGDGVSPKLKTVGYLTYDDTALYVGFECADGAPSKIRAPFSDRDNLTFDSDYAGILLDTRHDQRTALKFLSNARGVQQDSIQDDSNGSDDASLDMFWESAGKITSSGWTLEMRIPFSSLRYDSSGEQIWGVMLYRNTNRDTRYRYYSSPQPRNSNCSICHERELTGLQDLPKPGLINVTPYGTLNNRDKNAGIDAKWVPNPIAAIDATLNPDFSQVESDAAQISANNRFALFYPEKRSFFLEGLDLFSTPIQAVYTRTITSPGWGLRGTGRAGSGSYTLLSVHDKGGGSAIVPGPLSSSFVNQDFSSIASVGRFRYDIGRSFAGVLVTDREAQENGYNRVFGPDFQWNPNNADRLTGQWLYASSRTPRLSGLDPTWDGRRLDGYAGVASWNHSSQRLDWYAEYDDVSTGFLAEDGFVPQTGYRRGSGAILVKFFPKGFFSRASIRAGEDYSNGSALGTLRQKAYGGIEFEGKRSLWSAVDYNVSSELVSGKLLPRKFVSFVVEVVPSRVFGFTTVSGEFGEQIDYENARTGRGGLFSISGHLQPQDHVELLFSEALAWLDVDRGRLFTASVHRLKGTYNFTNRAFLRAIAQYVATRRDPSLYQTAGVRRHDASLSLSWLLAYKLNWQTVLFAGYGDDRAEDQSYSLVRKDRRLFLKVAYAFQN